MGKVHARNGSMFFFKSVILSLFAFSLAISAREHASTKKQAAQNTSLSLVRQLFHMGALEAAEPGQVQPKKKKTDEVQQVYM